MAIVTEAAVKITAKASDDVGTTPTESRVYEALGDMVKERGGVDGMWNLIWG